MTNALDKFRVVKDAQMPDLLSVSDRTWDRMKAVGDHPAKTQISECRIGYRLGDIEEWLKRRVVAPAGGCQLDEVNNIAPFEPIGDAARRVVESRGADIRDHQRKMQRELNRRNGEKDHEA